VTWLFTDSLICDYYQLIILSLSPTAKRKSEATRCAQFFNVIGIFPPFARDRNYWSSIGAALRTAGYVEDKQLQGSGKDFKWFAPQLTDKGTDWLLQQREVFRQHKTPAAQLRPEAFPGQQALPDFTAARAIAPILVEDSRGLRPATVSSLLDGAARLSKRKADGTLSRAQSMSASGAAEGDAKRLRLAGAQSSWLQSSDVAALDAAGQAAFEALMELRRSIAIAGTWPNHRVLHNHYDITISPQSCPIIVHRAAQPAPRLRARDGHGPRHCAAAVGGVAGPGARHLGRPARAVGAAGPRHAAEAMRGQRLPRRRGTHAGQQRKHLSREGLGIYCCGHETEALIHAHCVVDGVDVPTGARSSTDTSPRTHASAGVSAGARCTGCGTSSGEPRHGAL
jgi:hypothetical protein